MSLTHRMLSLALSAALFAAGVHAAPQAQDGAPLAEPSKSLYWQGHEALGRSDWRAALGHFRKLEKELEASKTEPADAAIYWQAYALSQAKRPREAKIEVERLRRAYPSSVWIDDADDLMLHVADDNGEKEDKADKGDKGDVAGKGDSPSNPREADALMALDALLASSNQKAVPLLQRVLAGNHTDRVKGRAIFVLSQIDPAAADDALQSVLNGNSSSHLKAEAIRMIAAGGRRSSLDRLLPLYRSSTDAAIKRGVVEAFLIGNRADLLRQVIDLESDAERRHDAIETLGAMGQADELSKLYATRSDPGDRRAVIDALGIAGARKQLQTLARSETDLKVRAHAIRAIGVAGGKEAGAVLVSFYTADAPEAITEAVLEGLMIASASREMIELYRKETDPERRKKLLHLITATGDDAALELIDEALR